MQTAEHALTVLDEVLSGSCGSGAGEVHAGQEGEFLCGISMWRMGRHWSGSAGGINTGILRMPEQWTSAEDLINDYDHSEPPGTVITYVQGYKLECQSDRSLSFNTDETLAEQRSRTSSASALTLQPAPAG